MKRERIFIQVKNNLTGRWSNVKSYNNYDEALKNLKIEKEKYPKAELRVRDNNLVSHTY